MSAATQHEKDAIERSRCNRLLERRPLSERGADILYLLWLFDGTQAHLQQIFEDRQHAKSYRPKLQKVYRNVFDFQLGTWKVQKAKAF